MRKFLMVALLLVSSLSFGAQKISKDDLDIHYSLFNSNFILPAVAKLNGLERSGKIALLNISLVRSGTGEKAQVKGKVNNLLGQSRNLDFIEIDEGSSVYYIAHVKLDSREVLKFDVQITDANNQQHQLKFSQEVFPE